MPRLVVVAALALAGPLAAQQNVVRGSYTAVSRDLTIVVRTDAPGELRLVHGTWGRIDVVARARHGVPVTSFGGRYGGELNLSNLGGEEVEYYVAVPPEARVTVRLPGSRSGASFSTVSDQASYAWDTPPAGATGPIRVIRPARASQQVAPGPGEATAPATPVGPDEPMLYTLDVALGVPDTIVVTGARRLRDITVRVGGDRYRLRADRPMQLLSGPTERLDVDAAGSRVRVDLPTGTRSFALSLDGRTALAVSDGQVTSICSSAARQTLPGGRLWITFASPGACAGGESPPAQRAPRSP